MNFTAHLHLSPNHPLVRVFNFSGDGFKGQSWRAQSTAVQRLGVDLHRFIDHFTDTHPEVLVAKRTVLHSTGLYAGVAWDLVADFYLHQHWSHLSSLQPHCAHLSATAFINQCTDELRAHRHLLKGRPSKMAPFLLDNGLHSYREISGLQRATRGIAQRHERAEGLVTFFESFTQNHSLEQAFLNFYPELVYAAQDFTRSHADFTHVELAVSS